jgi:hypothetical protein
MKYQCLAAAAVLAISTTAAAQIRFINPFGSPQGSVRQLVTTPSSNAYGLPPMQSNGLAVKYFAWGGHQWSNDTGQAFNTLVPYALGMGSTKVRFEVHDTPNDRGQSDPLDKRRAEISSSKEKFVNGVPYWMAFSFTAHWSCAGCQANTRQGGEIMQVHWPSGASPPLAFRLVPYGPGAGFRVTTRGDGQGNINRYTGPISLDQPHDVVFHFQLGAVGFEEVWLDGKQVSNVHNVPVGTDSENGYSMRLGPYYGGGLGGNVVVQEYGNVAAFPSTTSLSSRVFNRPIW